MLAIDVQESQIDALATRLGRQLAVSGGMIATVESCTGGLIARALTETPGSSQWFDRGFVTYSNEAKIEMVGVSAQTLAVFGAVSEPTALEMAGGALARSRARVSLSVTGVAGRQRRQARGHGLLRLGAGRRPHPDRHAALRRRSRQCSLAGGLVRPAGCLGHAFGLGRSRVLAEPKA